MTTTEILTILQKEIHSVVFATVDKGGLPQTCVIDLMRLDENGLYFLTAKGKLFSYLSGEGSAEAGRVVYVLNFRVSQEESWLVITAGFFLGFL